MMSLRFFPAAAFLFALVTLTSCARKITFIPNAAVPNAEGRIKVKKDNNDNYSINLSVKNLVPANQLQPPRSTYIVWMETLYNGTQNIGQLKINSSIFTSSPKASLETTTPYRPVRVFITAEDNLNSQYPGTQMVLSTTKF